MNGIVDGGAATWSRNVTASLEATVLIDLGGSFDIGTVRVWQRSDGCCQDRLRNFTVNLLEDDGSGQVGQWVESFTSVPEPSTSVLGLLAGLLVFRRRR